MPTKKMLKNGVTEDGMRELFKRGYTAEVVCAEEPYADKSGHSYRGMWHIRAVSPTGEIERVLITQRNEHEPKQLRTAFAVIKTLLHMGCDGVNIPFNEGGRRTNTIPHSNTSSE